MLPLRSLPGLLQRKMTGQSGHQPANLYSSFVSQLAISMTNESRLKRPRFRQSSERCSRSDADVERCLRVSSGLARPSRTTGLPFPLRPGQRPLTWMHLDPVPLQGLIAAVPRRCIWFIHCFDRNPHNSTWLFLLESSQHPSTFEVTGSNSQCIDQGPRT
jgi:hypothetical protein